MEGDEMTDKEDIGTISAVAVKDRAEFDGEDASDYALEGGDDTEGLDEVYENPGEVVEEELV